MSSSPTKVPPPVLPSSSAAPSTDTGLIDKAATLLPNAKINTKAMNTTNITPASSSSSSSSTATTTGTKTFSGDSSFGYRALRDFRKVLPTVLAKLPVDINAKDFREALRNVVTQHRDNLEKKLRNFNLDNEIILHELEIFRIGGEETFEDEVLRRQKYEEEQARLLTELANKAKSDLQKIQQEKEEAIRRVEEEKQRLIAEAERQKAEELQAIGNALLEQMKELQQQEVLRQQQEAHERQAAENTVVTLQETGNATNTVDTTDTVVASEPVTVTKEEEVMVPIVTSSPPEALSSPPPPVVEEKPLSPLQRIKLKTMAEIQPKSPATTAPVILTNKSSTILPSVPSTALPPVQPVIDPNDPLAEWKKELLQKETPEALKQILRKEVLEPFDTYLLQVRKQEPLPDSLLFVKRSEADNEAKRLMDNCVDKAKRILADIRCPATVEDGALSEQRAETVKLVDKECTGDTANKLANWVTQETVNRIDTLINERNTARALLARDTFERVLPIAMPKNCRCGIIAAHTELFTGVVKSIAASAPARSGEKIADQSIKGQHNTNESSTRKSFLKLTTSIKAMAKQAKKMVAAALNKEETDAEEAVIEKVEERNQTWADERAVTSMTAKAGNVQNTGGFYTALATGKWDCARALLEGTKKDAGAARVASSLSGTGSSSGVRLPYIAAEDVLDAEENEASLKNSGTEYTEYLLSQHYEDIDLYPDGTLAYAGGRLYRCRMTGSRHGIGAIFEPGVSGIIMDPLRIAVGAQSIRLMLSPGHLSAKDVNMVEVNRAVPAVVTEWNEDKLTGVARVFYCGKETLHKGRLLATLYFNGNGGNGITNGKGNEMKNVAEAAKKTNDSDAVSTNVAMTVVSNVVGVTYVVDPLTIDYA